MTSATLEPVAGLLRFKDAQAGRPRCVECGGPGEHLKLRCASCRKNPDKVAATQRAYKEKNRDKVAATRRAYYEKNRDKVAATKRHECVECGVLFPHIIKMGRPYTHCEDCEVNTITLYTVQSVDQCVPCRHCGQRIYLVKTSKGHMKPVDCSVEGTRRPSSSQPGEGVAHTSVCPKAPRQSHNGR